MTPIPVTQRDQVLPVPPTLDEYLTPQTPVRFVDAFIDRLDLEPLGFTRAIPARTGKPATSGGIS